MDANREGKTEHRKRTCSMFEKQFLKILFFVADALVLAWPLFGALQFHCCDVFLLYDGSNCHRREFAERQMLATQAPENRQNKHRFFTFLHHFLKNRKTP